jgi:hypothetical protein
MSGPLYARLIVVLQSGVERLQVLRSIRAKEIDHLLEQLVVVPHATKRTSVIVDRQHIRGGAALKDAATRRLRELSANQIHFSLCGVDSSTPQSSRPEFASDGCKPNAALEPAAIKARL